VKLRGYRIEPGEIEAQLLRHAQVKEAVVLVREDQPGDPRLVGYVVAAAGARLEVEGLREQLGRSLPAYMVPGCIVALERLPLTPNGQLDRRALPAPQGEVAQLIAQAWREVLGVERVGWSARYSRVASEHPEV